MVTLSPELAELSATATILPRSESFSAVSVHCSDLSADESLRPAIALLEGGDAPRAWAEIRPLAESGQGIATLLGGAIALQAGAVDDGIATLERALEGRVAENSAENGRIVLAFSDEGMLVFHLNGLAAIALLVYGYARAGRDQDAFELAAQAHTVVGAEAFLALHLLLLRDRGQWAELLNAAAAANPNDRGRFEITLLKGQALENTDQRSEALDLYADLARINENLTWLEEARRRIDHISEWADSQLAALEAAGNGLADEPLDTPAAPSPPAPQPPTVAPPLRMSGDAGLFEFVPEPSLDGSVSLITLAEAPQPSSPDAWIERCIEGPADVVLEQFDASSDSEWKPVLRALLAAAAEENDDAERLAEVIGDQAVSRYVSKLSRWTQAGVLVYLGETLLVLSDGADAFVLTLAARLHHRGDTDAARAWVSWARALQDSTPLEIADVALALAAEDVAEALAVTSHAPHDGVGGVVLQGLRARALEQSGKTEAALTVYGEARRGAERLGEDGVASNLALRFARARLLARLGQNRRAREDLHAIQAVEHDYLGVDELLEATEISKTERGRPDREMRRAVFERDRGACAECGGNFDLQYDHVLPVALGGATTIENLQLLCGECNQRKGPRI